MKKLLLILMFALAGSGINAMNDDSDGVDPEDTRPQRWIYQSEPMPEKKADCPVDFKAFEKAVNEVEAHLAKAKAQKAQEVIVAAQAAQKPVGRLKGMAQWIANHQKTAVLVALLGCYAGSYTTEWISAGINFLYSAANTGCQRYGDYAVLNSICPTVVPPVEPCTSMFWC